MEIIDAVLARYIPTSTELIGGQPRRRKVSAGNDVGADYQIRKELPDILREEVTKSGRDVATFKVYGSVGQINFPISQVPWVSALLRKITTSTRRGYYIVLLFREDMAGCVLSLNQGFTQYREIFGTDLLAERKAKEGAALAATYLDVPAGFVRGEIDLAATGDLGKGYEQGAIISKVYAAGEPSMETLSGDFQILLDLYDVLYKRLGSSIVDNIPPPEEQEFQKAATALSANKAGKKKYQEPPPGPVPPPPPMSTQVALVTSAIPLSQVLRYRNLDISANATRRTCHSCQE
jgi:5-methylcytosine-specific restriction enzyme A